MTVWLASFFTQQYKWSAELLRHTALLTGQVDKVQLFTPSDIKDFTDAHSEMFHEGSKGFGYWSWKPEIILRAMDAVKWNDWLVYADAGIMFVSDIQAYIKAAGDKDVLLFQLGEAVLKDYRNSQWTKPATFELMKCEDEAFRSCFQINAGLCMFRKSPAAYILLNSWKKWSTIKQVIDDSGPPAPRAHRHDQCILTNLCYHSEHRNHIKVLRDCTQYGVNDDIVSGGPSLPVLVDHHRRQYSDLRTTMVITPTIGRDTLRECIQSVQNQELPCVEHLVVIDGPQYAKQVQDIVAEFQHKKPIHMLQLPINTGANGFNGHRCFGSMPYLCNTEYVSFLDDDNLFKEDHLLQMMRLVAKDDLDGSFSLRSIHGKDMRFADAMFMCNDSCESLGSFCPSVLSNDDFFVDTSCMMVKRDVAIRLAPLWNSRFRSGAVEADRAFSKALLKLKVRGVPQHTVQYRLGGSPGSVTADFFLQGNAKTRYDFSKPNLYVFHFNPPATRQALEVLWDNGSCQAYREWQMTLLKGLTSSFNIMNGYVCQDMLQPGSVVYADLCNPDELPLGTVFSRTDLRRVCYSLESPNHKHAGQWDLKFLKKHFDVVLTYWGPLLREPSIKTVPCLHNTHHLDLSSPVDRERGLRQNLGTNRSVCMVLENRRNRGTYSVNGVKLHVLDYLREHYVWDLKNATVFGKDWAQACLGEGVKVGHSKHRNHDDRSSVDHMQQYVFCLIIENCNAEGYISEKLYDAFSAGCIPLYYDGGNNNQFTAIPRDMYIDISRFESSQELQSHIDSLTDDDIRSLQKTIYDKREQVLSRVSVQAHAAVVGEAVKLL